MSAPDSPWSDLPTRVASAAVLVVLGGLAIWWGGRVFTLLVLVLCAAMMWELSRLSAPRAGQTNLALAALAPVSLLLERSIPLDMMLLVLLAPPVLLVLTPRRDRWLAAAYGLAIMLAGYGLPGLGRVQILWLVAVVVASDVLGYFAGRMIGGPKFWPKMSPNKTWSGTFAGWIGALLVGVAFSGWIGGGWQIIALSPLLAFAGQMGDIAKSWIKRRAGVKDFSNLIPGHGGVIDRFDAIVGAAVALVLLQALIFLVAKG